MKHFKAVNKCVAAILAYLSIEALQKVLGVDFKSNQVEVAVCSKDRTRFRSLEEKEIDEYLTIISEKD